MVNGIEGLGSVQKKAKTLSVGLDAFKEELVNGTSVVSSALAPEKALLARFNEVDHTGHDKGSNSGGQEPVVGVSDADGTGVRDKARGFFRNKEEDSMVENRGDGRPRPSAGGQQEGEGQPSRRPRARQQRGYYQGQPRSY